MRPQAVGKRGQWIVEDGERKGRGEEVRLYTKLKDSWAGRERV